MKCLINIRASNRGQVKRWRGKKGVGGEDSSLKSLDSFHAAASSSTAPSSKAGGKRSRGSRYNSAIGYINTADKKGSECLIVVVSKDGMMNLMPDLQDRVRRSAIQIRLERLRAVVAPEIVDAGEYYKTLNWLSAGRFYLAQDECDEINEIKNATKLRLDKQQGYSMTPADFKPNEEMRDKYFLEEGSRENGR
jgi:hypothetical protein